MAYTTWNPSRKSATVTLSGGNLVATNTAGDLGNVYGVDPQNTGKFYFEATLTSDPGIAVTAIGVCNGTYDLSSYPTSSGAFGAIVCDQYGGYIYLNGATVAGTKTVGAVAATDVICVAVDLTNHLIWFRKNAGNWNGTVGADPATGTSGSDISPLISAGYQLYPVAGVQHGSSAGAWTANFGATAFAQSVPSGFTSGWTSGTSVVSNATVTQTGSSVWAINPNPPIKVTQLGASAWIDISTTVVMITGLSLTSGLGSVDEQLNMNGEVTLNGLETVSVAAAPSPESDIDLTGIEASTAQGTVTAAIGGSAGFFRGFP